MKAGDVSVVQYDTVHGGTRVLPLHSVADLASVAVENGVDHSWVVVAYATDEGAAQMRLKEFKQRLKNGKPPVRDESCGLRL